jgi:hypothetical protein
MASDYDRQQWQAEEAAREAALEKQRGKERKTRERAARNAKRKLARLERTLSDKGQISEFEAEFAESVSDRLEKFGSAFHDLEKGRPGDALSFAQKRVVASMNRKVKDLKKKQTPVDVDAPDDDELTRPRYNGAFKRSSFKSKKPKFSARVRQLDEDYIGEDQKPSEAPIEDKGANTRPPVGKPFLRIVRGPDD